MKKTESISSMLNEKTSRRQALKSLGIGTLGLTSLAALAQNVTNVVTGTNAVFPNAVGNAAARLNLGAADVNTLNFALNLEYLEAEFYTLATTGAGLEAQGIDVTGRGQPGAVTVKANPLVTFVTPAIQQYALEIAADERAHVLFLRQVLGSRAIARPAIDLTNSFTAIAQAAGLVGVGETFDPFADELSFLLSAFIFEDVGVTAYRGATARLVHRTVLSAAAGILGTEAYHAGNVRTKIFEFGEVAQAAAQSISDLRDTLDGASDTDQGVTSANNQGIVGGGTANIVPTDANGLVFSRTLRQVLNIVYLAVDANSGGFFPNGVNALNTRVTENRRNLRNRNTNSNTGIFETNGINPSVTVSNDVNTGSTILTNNLGTGGPVGAP